MKAINVFLALIIALAAAACPPVAMADEPEDPGDVSLLPPELDPANDELLQIMYVGATTAWRTPGLASMVAPTGTMSIIDAQAMYYAWNTRYWQGLPTHSQIPDVAAPSVPDMAASHPTDQPESWLDVDIYLPDPMSILMRVDTYRGPGGDGYVAVSQVIVSGTLWQRSINVGPETWRSKSWLPTFVSPLEP